MFNRYNDKLAIINEQDLVQKLTKYTQLHEQYTHYKTKQSILNNQKTTLLEKQLLLETTSISKREKLLQTILDSYISEEHISDISKH